MSDEKSTDDTILEEFRSLGNNLVSVVRSAWESPERKKLQQEIEEGLAQLANTLKMEIDTFNESPAGQRIRTDVEDLRERVRTGEAESKFREEILKALRMINAELEKNTTRWSNSESGSENAPSEKETGS